MPNLLRRALRPVLRPVLRSPLAPREGVGDIIRSIFADGTDGFYFDFSKTDRLFQDVAGQTPADDAGENIYRGLESHAWGGNTLAGFLAQQTELVTNGGLADGTGWGGTTWSFSGGAAVCNGSSSLFQAVAAASGKIYRVTFDVVAYTSGTLQATIGNGTAVAGLGSLGSKSILVVCGAEATPQLRLTGGSLVASIDNVSVKEIPGNHGLQATTSAQPKWQTGGLARFDGSDDNLLTTLAPATAFTMLFKLKLPTAGVSTKIFAGCRAATDTRMYLALNPDGTLCAGLGTQAANIIKGATDRGGATGVAAFAFDGSRCELLWNAVREYEDAQSGSPTTTSSIALGAWNDGGVVAAFANPDIYHALAIKKRLTQAEIAAVTNLWGTS